MSKPDKIIFLDIDGPMIPYTDYLFDKHCSWSQNLNPQCVRVLRKIVDESGAKIVFNTTHNNMLDPYKSRDGKIETPGLIKRFVDAGFGSDIHKDGHTKYPNIDRMAAIAEWLSRNKTDNMLWVALDDVKIDHKRAFLVDPDNGIGLDAYNHCAKYLMFKSFIVW